MKPIVWMGSSRRDLKSFPEEVQDRAGFELFLLQSGEEPSDFKPMPAIGGGVYEIRIHTQTEHRVVYIAKYGEAVYVLHAFEKRTRKTSPRDLAVARRRLAEVGAARRRGR